MKRRGYAPSYAALAKMLREERLRASLTQAALAERLGKPQSFVAKYENGERQLDVVEFLLVTRAIGVVGATLLRRFEQQGGLKSPSARRDLRTSSTSGTASESAEASALLPSPKRP